MIKDDQDNEDMESKYVFDFEVYTAIALLLSLASLIYILYNL